MVQEIGQILERDNQESTGNAICITGLVGYFSPFDNNKIMFQCNKLFVTLNHFLWNSAFHLQITKQGVGASD